MSLAWRWRSRCLGEYTDGKISFGVDDHAASHGVCAWKPERATSRGQLLAFHNPLCYRNHRAGRNIIVTDGCHRHRARHLNENEAIKAWASAMSPPALCRKLMVRPPNGPQLSRKRLDTVSPFRKHRGGLGKMD
jgi:hypothetical protein